MRTFLRVRGPIAYALMLAFANGCYGWATERTDLAAYVVEENPRDIRVHITEPGGTVEYQVQDPAVSNDSLRGSFMFVDRNQWTPLATPGFPLADIEAPPFEVRRHDSVKTGFLVIGTLAAVAAVAFAIWAISFSANYRP